MAAVVSLLGVTVEQRVTHSSVEPLPPIAEVPAAPSSLASADAMLSSADWEELSAAAEKYGIPASMLRRPEHMVLSMLPPHERPVSLEALQRRGQGDPNKWVPDEPFNLDKYTYTNPDVRKAIVDGVNFVLDQQRENGSWDVELTGFLGETADQAVDAVIATSLAGLALRPHANVDPERVNAALRKGSDFVMARIIRGKLSLQVFYAAWRYILGLRFLNSEYGELKSSTVKDEARMEEIHLVMKRMMQSLLDMQLSSQKAGTVDGKKKRKIKSRGVKGEAQFASLGIKMAPPTDTDFRGGALVREVVEGGPGHKGGIRPGDRVYRINKFVRVENAYDYYMEEANFMEGQTHELEYYRPTGEGSAPDKKKAACKIEQKWPANIGVTIEANGDEGVRVTGHTPMSGSRKELLVGDVIVAIKGEDIVADPKKPETQGVDWVKKFYEIEAGLKPLTSIRLSIIRDGKKKGVTLSKDQVRPKPEGSIGITPLEEDRCSLDGVTVDQVERGTVGETAGFQKGDRVIEIAGVPILGFDHFFATTTTMWQDTLVKVKYLRPNFVFSEDPESRTPVATLDDIANYSEHEVEMRLGPSIDPGDMQCGLDIHRMPTGQLLVRVTEVMPKGVSDGKLRKDDVIIKFNGQAYDHYIEFLFFCLWRTPAGEEVTFTVIRGSKEVDVTIEFAKQPEAEEVTAEGGWNYYPRGMGTSFTTAAVVIGLTEVEQVSGFKFPALAMKAAVNAVASTRHPDPNKKGEAYVYDQRSMEGVPAANVANFRDIRGGIGRIVACELAAAMKDSRRGKSKLTGAVDTFLVNRHEIDRVRNFWHTHYYPRWANAAYYWFYGHYHALLAVNYLDPAGKAKLTKTVHETCIKALMLKLHDRRPGTDAENRPEGTWLDHHDFGPLVGTCEALMCFGQIPGSFRNAVPGDAVITPTGTDDKGKEAKPAGENAEK